MTAPVRPDGRRQRAARNQDAVVEAMLDLYREGLLRPSAAAIAVRAGVSERTVFRLFDDRDALDALALQAQWARVAHLFAPPDDGGERELRIAALVAQRLALFTEIAPVARVAQLRAPFSSAIRQGIERRGRILRDQIARQFHAELAPLPDADRDELLAALDAATSIELLERLSSVQALAPAAAGRVLTRLLRALLADAETRS